MKTNKRRNQIIRWSYVPNISSQIKILFIQRGQKDTWAKNLGAEKVICFSIIIHKAESNHLIESILQINNYGGREHAQGHHDQKQKRVLQQTSLGQQIRVQ
jgi:hypothetical protein